jgi:hypothetical protein
VRRAGPVAGGKYSRASSASRFNSLWIYDGDTTRICPERRERVERHEVVCDRSWERYRRNHYAAAYTEPALELPVIRHTGICDHPRVRMGERKARVVDMVMTIARPDRCLELWRFSA